MHTKSYLIRHTQDAQHLSIASEGHIRAKTSMYIDTLVGRDFRLLSMTIKVPILFGFRNTN